MPTGSGPDVYVRPNQNEGGWNVVKQGSRRASVNAPTKSDAISFARRLIRKQGHGELRISNGRG
ncbi:MAG TPA: DUF2188 domain-containing protein [Solirubrobacterales bacterium]|nr:DUF2188 domain-containing protein [Solirubrobacterales bacterium]